MGEIIARNMFNWLKLLASCYCWIQLVVYTIESEMHCHTHIKYVSYVKNVDYMTTDFSAGGN